MTWKSRLALPECNRPGCGNEKLDGAAYCREHLDDQRMRAKVCAKRRRAFRKVQIVMLEVMREV